MRLGLIARADNSGLGVQTHEMYRHLRPAKTLVIDVGYLHNTTTHANKATYLDRYPDAIVSQGWQPSTQALVALLRDVDVVVTCETPYGHELLPLARMMGVRTVICPNYEFLDRSHQPNLWAAPSLWHWNDIPEPKIHLPVPIATDRFTPRASDPGPRHFLHIVGRPAIHDRNGTEQLLASLRHVNSEIRLTLKCQDSGYLHRLISHNRIPSNVQLSFSSTDVRNYWQLCNEGDVMILPRRFGGLCLPANEALGAGMPVIMPDISPNNTWLPAEWLVPARKTEQFQAYNLIDVFTVDHVALARKIDQFATDDDFYATAKAETQQLAQQYSWDNLKSEYESVLAGSLVA